MTNESCERNQLFKMLEPTDDVMDIADSDFLEDEFFDDDGGSDSDSGIEKYCGMFSPSKNRLFGRKESLHVILGSGKCMQFHKSVPVYSL